MFKRIYLCDHGMSPQVCLKLIWRLLTDVKFAFCVNANLKSRCIHLFCNTHSILIGDWHDPNTNLIEIVKHKCQTVAKPSINNSFAYYKLFQ